MCLLSYFPEGILPDPDLLDCGAACNRDGHGWAIVIPGKDEIKVFKSLDASQAIDEFVRVRTMYPDGPAMFHSRLTTHGNTTKDNCHPFRVNGDARTVLGHNGILPTYSEKGREVHPAGHFVKTEWKTQQGNTVYGKRWVETDDRSDTRIFAEDVVWREYPHLDSPKTRKRLTKWLGTGNKVLILTTDPRFKGNAYLFNEGLGEWHDGAWYSNSSYLPMRYVYRSKHTAWWDDNEYYPDASKWSTGSDDATGWPVTLGGTRTKSEPKGPTMVTCDLCAMPETVIASYGLCISCRGCNDCLYQIGQCACHGRPLPEGPTFRELSNALSFGDAVDIADAVERYHYIQRLVEGAAWKVKGAKALGSGTKAIEQGPSLPTPEFSDSGVVDGEVIGSDITMPL